MRQLQGYLSGGRNSFRSFPPGIIHKTKKPTKPVVEIEEDDTENE